MGNCKCKVINFPSETTCVLILESGCLTNEKNSLEVDIDIFDCMFHFEYPHLLNESKD